MYVCCTGVIAIDFCERCVYVCDGVPVGAVEVFCGHLGRAGFVRGAHSRAGTVGDEGHGGSRRYVNM